MAIAELTSVVTPPKHPLEAGPVQKWEAIQQLLGTRLPNDLRDFGLTFGSGRFVDQGILVFNPFAVVFPEQMEGALEIWRSLKMGEGDREVPFAIYPDAPGLLPWGWDETGAGMFWLTEGKADNWPILLRGHDEAIYARFEMHLSTFLSKVMKLEILLPGIWPSEMFRDPNRRLFQPVEFKRKDPQLKSIFELYQENGNNAGFWVQHQSWDASDTDVMVKTVAGKSEGTLPDYSSETSSVRVDVYVNGVLSQKNFELPIAFDQSFCRVPPPNWLNGEA